MEISTGKWKAQRLQGPAGNPIAIPKNSEHDTEVQLHELGHEWWAKNADYEDRKAMERLHNWAKHLPVWMKDKVQNPDSRWRVTPDGIVLDVQHGSNKESAASKAEELFSTLFALHYLNKLKGTGESKFNLDEAFNLFMKGAHKQVKASLMVPIELAGNAVGNPNHDELGRFASGNGNGLTDAQENKRKEYESRSPDKFQWYTKITKAKQTVLLARYKIPTGGDIFDWIFPDGKVGSGGTWPQTTKSIKRKWKGHEPKMLQTFELSLDTDIQQAANDTDTSPTEGQKKAGNYRHGSFRVHGLKIVIENPKGSIRSGKDANGKVWNQTMAAHYGYIGQIDGDTADRTSDGDHCDVFVGNNPDQDKVHVVNQTKPDGSFDEVKLVIGEPTAADAEKLYKSNYEPGWNNYTDVVPLSIDEFKDWLRTGDKTKPVEQSVKASLDFPIELRNDNHDEKGRFSSGSKSPEDKMFSYVLKELHNMPEAKDSSEAGFILPSGKHVTFPDGVHTHTGAVGGAGNLDKAVKSGVIRYRPWSSVVGVGDKSIDFEIGAEPQPEQYETIKRIINEKNEAVRADIVKIVDGKETYETLRTSTPDANKIITGVRNAFAGSESEASEDKPKYKSPFSEFLSLEVPIELSVGNPNHDKLGLFTFAPDKGGDFGGGEKEYGGGMAAAILRNAQKIAFVDEPITGEPTIGRRDYDEIEEVMTAHEQSEMEEALLEARDWAFDDVIREHDSDINIEDIEVNHDRAVRYAGWTTGDIRDKAIKAADGLEDVKVKDTARTSIQAWYNDSNYDGVDGIKSLVDHLREQDMLDTFADSLEPWTSDAEDEIVDAEDNLRQKEYEKAVQQEQDDYREALNRDYDDSDDKREYLKNFYDDHSDEARFSGGEEKQDVWGKDEDGDPIYKFKAASGQSFTITGLSRKLDGLPATEIQFKDDNEGFGKTGKGAGHEVFRKVVTAVVAFMLKANPEALEFSAAEKSRRKLYDYLVKTVAKVISGYSAIAGSDNPGSDSFANPKYYLLTKTEKMPEYRKAISRQVDDKNIEVLLSLCDRYEEIVPEIQEAWFTPAAWALELDIPITLSDNDDVQWITVNGRHIPIGKGETKEEAVKKAFAKFDKPQTEKAVTPKEKLVAKLAGNEPNTKPAAAKFDAKEWASKSMDDRREDWGKLSQSERDEKADAAVSVTNRIQEHLKGMPERPETKDLSKDVQARIEQFKDRIHPQAADKIRSVSKDYQAAMAGAGVDAVTQRALAMEAVDSLAAQEIEAMGRQLGDHGIAHIKGDIDVAQQTLDAIPLTTTPKEKVMLQTACIFHDIGYLAPPSQNFLDEGHHRWSEQHYNEHIRPLVEKALGKQMANEVSHIIRTHDALDMDWKGDTIASAVRLADNLAVFHAEKLPPLFRYVPGTLDVLKDLGAKKIDADEAHKKLLGCITNSKLPKAIQERLGEAAREVSAYTPKVTLGMLGGVLSSVKWNKAGYVVAEVTENKKATELNKLGDFGQSQFRKLAKTYGADPDQFQKDLNFTFNKNGGKTVLQIEMKKAGLKLTLEIPIELSVGNPNHDKLGLFTFAPDTGGSFGISETPSKLFYQKSYDYKLPDGSRLSTNQRDMLQALGRSGSLSGAQLRRTLTADEGLAQNRQAYQEVTMPLQELERAGLVKQTGYRETSSMSGPGFSYAGPGSSNPNKPDKTDPALAVYELTDTGHEKVSAWMGQTTAGNPTKLKQEVKEQPVMSPQEVYQSKKDFFDINIKRYEKELAAALKNKKPRLEKQARKQLDSYKAQLSRLKLTLEIPIEIA